MNIRLDIFGRPEERQAKLLPGKMPKQAEAIGLTDVVIPREETRRTDMRHLATVTFRERIHEVRVINLSGGGAMISARIQPNIGEHLNLHFGENHGVGCLVRWVRGDRVGFEFAHETEIECLPETRDEVLRQSASSLACEARVPMVTVPAATAENRNAARHPLIWSGELSYGSHKWAVRLRNISETGALIQCTGALRLNSEVVLSLKDGGDLIAYVTWAVGDHAGPQFAEPFDLGRLSACKPQVTPATWVRPAYLEAHAAAESAWDDAWNRMSLGELRSQLDGILKR